MGQVINVSPKKRTVLIIGEKTEEGTVETTT